MKVALYARVSKADDSQNPETQLLRLRKYAEERGWQVFDEYVDRASGADANRPRLDRMLADARANRFGIVVTTKVDRLARSTINLYRLLSELECNNVAFHCTDQDISTVSSTGKLLLAVLAGVAEFERELIRERTTAALATAKARGQCLGRPPNRSRTSEIQRLKNEGLTIRQIASRIGITPQGVKQRLRRDRLQKRGVSEG